MKDNTMTIQLSNKMYDWLLTNFQDTLTKQEKMAIQHWKNSNTDPHLDEITKLGYNNGFIGNYLIGGIIPRPYPLPRFDNLTSTNHLSRFLRLTMFMTKGRQDIIQLYKKYHGEHSLVFSKHSQTIYQYGTPKQVAQAFIKTFQLNTNHQYSFAKLRVALDMMGGCVLLDNYVPSADFNYKRMPLNNQECSGFSLFSQQAPMIFINSRDSLNQQTQIMVQSMIMFMNHKSIIFGSHFTIEKQSRLNQIIDIVLKMINYQSSQHRHLKMDYHFAWIIMDALYYGKPFMSYHRACRLLNVRSIYSQHQLIQKLQTEYRKSRLPQRQFANE